MKKGFLYIVFFVFLSTICNLSIDYTVGKQLEKRSPYYLAFSSIGVNSLECGLDCWAKIKTTSSKEELERYLINFLQSLGLPIEVENFIYESKTDSLILYFESKLDNKEYVFILESDAITQESYFIINFVTTDEAEIEEVRRKFSNIIGINWSYYYQYLGWLDLPLDMKGCQELFAVMAKNLEISNPQVSLSGKKLSSTAYSKKLKDMPEMLIEEKAINLQIVIQVDEDLEKTKIIIASPLLLNEK